MARHIINPHASIFVLCLSPSTRATNVNTEEALSLPSLLPTEDPQNGINPGISIYSLFRPHLNTQNAGPHHPGHELFARLVRFRQSDAGSASRAANQRLRYSRSGMEQRRYRIWGAPGRGCSELPCSSSSPCG
ncbi:hypothetical protein IWZ01DRAFT_347060 [Phyllosticta capitalensis]